MAPHIVRCLEVLASTTGLAGAQIGPDLAALLRHALRAEEELTGNRRTLPVPHETPWPDPGPWRRWGFTTKSQGSRTQIGARGWRPTWALGSDPSRSALRAESRTGTSPIPADPYVTGLTGYDSYTSAHQRDAIRAALLLPPGGVLAVSLPTGHGKTSVALAAASAARGTSVLIVPTTALALDMEARVRGLYLNRRASTPAAYHSGLAKIDAEAVRHAIRTGSQGIVITSPESLVGPLRHSVLIAAERGTLELLIVDEAHVVAQWGDSFRPAFQLLPALRRTALDLQQGEDHPLLRTLLLTATFTDYSIGLLSELFESNRPMQLAGGQGIRPEHDYWTARFPNEQLRTSAVLDAVAHLPRPAIVYTTTRKSAAAIHRHLVQEGYQRLALFTGETAPPTRESIIERWRRDQLDLVVATSAFGLGVDVPHVRAIVHATVPETVDRLYQEVGRSGRDGRAAVAIQLFTDSDLRLARRMRAKGVLTTTLARDRWRTMRQEALKSDDDTLVVNVDARRVGLKDETDWNRQWNFRTLQLMARAGAIRLEVPDLPEEEEPDWDTWHGSLRVRLRRFDLELDDGWNAFDRVRARIRSSQDGPDAVDRERCIGELLAEAYSLEFNGTSFAVLPSCGGCPACREVRREPYDSGLSRTFSWTHASLLSERLARDIGHVANTLLITYDSIDELEAVIAFLQARGMRQILSSGWGTVLVNRVSVSVPFVDTFDSESNTPLVVFPDSVLLLGPETRILPPTARDVSVIVASRALTHTVRDLQFLERRTANLLMEF